MFAIALASVFLAAAVGVDAARADVYTFAFTGRVTSIRDGLGAFGPQAAALTSFSGTFTFDTSTPTTFPLPPGATEAVYQHRSPPAGVSVQLGEFGFRTDAAHTDFRVLVRNAFGYSGSDDYGFHSFHNEANGLFGDWPLDILEINWIASTFDDDLFADLSLPIVPPDLRLLGPGQFEIFGECFACDVPDPTFEVLGELTTLTSASGPTTGDLNGDGRVDAADVASLVQQLGHSDGGESAARSPSDLNGDGQVGLADLMMLQANLSSPETFVVDALPDNATARLALPANGVPEPSCVALIAAAAVTLAMRRAMARRPSGSKRRRS